MNVDGSVVRIFWDNSNLFHAAQNACDKAGIWIDQGHRYDGRLRFDHVVEFAAPGRRIGKAVAVGSMPLGLDRGGRTFGATGSMSTLGITGQTASKNKQSTRC